MTYSILDEIAFEGHIVPMVAILKGTTIKFPLAHRINEVTLCPQYA